LPHRPAEAYALDIAFVKDLNGCSHASKDCFGLAPAATASCVLWLRGGSGGGQVGVRQIFRWRDEAGIA
jgi:hypothetical protein